MTRFLRFFLVMLFLAGVQLTAKAEDEKYEVMEVNGVWYKVPYIYVYHYIDDDNGYYRYEPDQYGTTVICPPDGYPLYRGDINIPNYLELDLYADSFPFEPNVNYIEDNAFKNSEITSVYIPPTVYTIGESAFEGCHKLERVVFGVNERKPWDTDTYYHNRYLYQIGNSAFKECISLQNITIPYSDSAVSSYDGSQYSILGEYVFERCTSLERVIYEEGIEMTGSDCFYGCVNLLEVVIPQSMTHIDDLAFYGCPSLDKIELSDKIWGIGIGAFKGCTSLESVVLNDNIKEICKDVFYGCTSLKSVTYKSVDQELSSKYSVVLPEGLRSLSWGSFAFCQSLKSVFVPASTSIYEGSYYGYYTFVPVFYGCSSLEIIDIDKDNPYNVFVDKVLYNKDMTRLIQSLDRNVNSFTVPESVTTIGSYSFDSLDNLKEIKLNEGLKDINWYAFRGTGLKDVTIPSSVTKIWYSAFSGCDSLENVKLNEGLETIDHAVFKDCPLKYVIIPASVKEIGIGVFEKSTIDCTPLTVINYSETPLPIPREGLIIFNEQPDLQKMYVPKGCKEAYEKAEGIYAHWAKSFTIYEMDELDGIEKTTNDGVKYSIAGDFLSIDNADNGTAVSIYGIDGRLIASDIVKHGAANINISKHKGRVAILRIGNKKHKVVL